MVKDPEVPGHDLVLQDGAKRDIYLVSRVCDDNDSSPKHHVFAKGDISRYSQVIQVQDVWDAGKSLQKLIHLM